APADRRGRRRERLVAAAVRDRRIADGRRQRPDQLGRQRAGLASVRPRAAGLEHGHQGVGGLARAGRRTDDRRAAVSARRSWRPDAGRRRDRADQLQDRARAPPSIAARGSRVSEATGERLWTRAFVLAWAANFLHSTGFHAYVHLPGWLEGRGAGEVLIGVLIAMMSVAAISTRPFVGRM